MYIDLNNFQKIYCEKVKPLEEKFENDKVIVRIKIFTIVIIAILIEILLLYVTLKTSNSRIFEFFIDIIILAFILSIAVIKSFTNKAKKIIFPELFRSIDNNLIYDSKVKDSKYKFIDSKLYNSNNCSYISQDSITTRVDNKNIVMYELQVETGSGKNKSIKFSGVFLNIVLDKTLKSDMKIIYNTSKDFGIIKTLFANEDKVNLENIDFENKYDVYCHDQIYARKIITLTFMEKLLVVTDKLNKQIQISFRNNNIYIAISGLQLINDDALFVTVQVVCKK